MAIITVVTALLLLLSGGLKVRSGMRVGVGFSPLAAVEVVAGLAFLVAAMPGLLQGGLPRWALPIGVVLVFGSTAEHMLRLRRRRRFREESEAGRLQAYLQVNARTEEAD